MQAQSQPGEALQADQISPNFYHFSLSLSGVNFCPVQCQLSMLRSFHTSKLFFLGERKIYMKIIPERTWWFRRATAEILWPLFTIGLPHQPPPCPSYISLQRISLEENFTLDITLANSIAIRLPLPCLYFIKIVHRNII